jgi:AcrR family transcriptional regulator
MKNATVRQKEIIAAALGIVGEHGLERLTMKNIAARVGFSDAAVYRHFRNKADVLSAMVDDFVDSSLMELNRIRKGSGSGLDQVKRFFFDRCRSFAADRALAAVMFSGDLFRSEPAIATRLHDAMQDHRRLLLQAIRRDQRLGLLKPLPPEHVFTVVMGSLRLLVQQWQAGGHDFDLPAAGEKLWRTLETLIAENKGDSHEKKNHTH